MFRSVAALVFSLILPTLASAQEVVHTQQRTHEVVKGETLWNLAQRYMGNPYRWPLIYEANEAQLPDPNIIEPGQVLVIPGVPVAETSGEEARPQQELAQIQELVVTTERPSIEPSESLRAVPARSPVEGSELFPWRRTTFYPDPVNQTNQDRMFALARQGEVVASSAITTVAVPMGIVYGSEWLIPPEQEDRYLGTLEGYSRVPAAGARPGPARIGEGVLITPEPGARFQVGDLLQSFRTVRRERRLGSVQQPSGILVVAEVREEAVVAMVASEFDRVWLGDWVRPVPVHVAVPGHFPTPLESEVSATIVGFPEERVVQGYGAAVFLDVGSQDGIGIGDVFRAHVDEPGPAFGLEAARLQVILVSEYGSTARVVSITYPGIETGDRLRLIEKMQ